LSSSKQQFAHDNDTALTAPQQQEDLIVTGALNTPSDLFM